MKKILIVLGVLVIALTVGIAYAGTEGMRAGEYNGVTAFERVPIASHDLSSGLYLENGITAFEPLPAQAWEGAAAGGLRTMEPTMKLQNGITYFDTGVPRESH
ncbi:MAG TPA: hypothetical protein VEI57_05260 [Nitrospirota bacterium]|nr:hypothetical protein [Nitrospirota bacterium]